MRNAPRICALSLPEARRSARFVLSRKNAVEHLLHVTQVDLDLAADLREQHALLRALAHLVEHRRAVAGAERPERAASRRTASRRPASGKSGDRFE
jgi:hypothetical protein